MATLNNPRAADLLPDVLRLWVGRASRSAEGAPEIYISGEQVPTSELSNERGLLPLVCWHMDAIYRFAMGTPLGVTFRTNPRALLGCEVELGHIDKPMSEVLCFLFEAAEDLLQHSPRTQLANKGSEHKGVELSGLVSKFKEEIASARNRAAAPQSPVKASPRFGVAIQ